MLKKLKERVLKANKELGESGLVKLTWGNVSAFDKDKQLLVIKPSGVPYKDLTIDDMVVVSLDGKVVEGNLSPSSDTPTHIELYKKYPSLGGIVHTHSTYATAFAQAGKGIKPYGTTHADCFYGEIPCARVLSDDEINTDYEKNTGKVIIETFENKDITAIPAILLEGHGIFTFSSSPEKALEVAITLEEVAKIAYLTERLNDKVKPIKQTLLDKHYLRKHGKDAYYGQKK